jgi:hypothetical protein
LSEDAVIGTVCAALQYVDLDQPGTENSNVSFRIVSGDEMEQFSVSNSGIVSIQSTLDREEISSYTLRIAITDMGAPALTNFTTVTVTVSDVNDNTPLFVDTEYTCTITEESDDVGTDCVTVVANDIDDPQTLNSEFTFDIVGGSTQFEIDSSSGQITTFVVFDYETV